MRFSEAELLDGVLAAYERGGREGSSIEAAAWADSAVEHALDGAVELARDSADRAARGSAAWRELDLAVDAWGRAVELLRWQGAVRSESEPRRSTTNLVSVRHRGGEMISWR